MREETRLTEIDLIRKKINQFYILDGHFVYSTRRIVDGKEIFRHGSRYINKDRIFADTYLLNQLCDLLAIRYFTSHEPVDVVVGPESGGAKVALTLTHRLRMLYQPHVSYRREYPTQLAFVSAKKVAGTEFFKISERDVELVRKKRVLVAEDILNTGRTVRHTINAIRKVGGYPKGTVALFNRGVDKHRQVVGCNDIMDSIDVLISLIEFNQEEFPVYDAGEENCPLCYRGIDINTNVGHGQAYLDSLTV